MSKYRTLFVAFLAVTIVWVYAITCASSIRFGAGWIDYLALKALGWQFLASSNDLRQLWHPFVLPPVLLALTEPLVGQGPDFLLANTAIWMGVFVFGFVSVSRRLTPWQTAIFLALEFIYINWPAPIDTSFGPLASFAFANFYNRYLDALWGFVFVLYFSPKVKDTWPDILLCLFLLTTAYFSKLSYFAGYALAFIALAVTQKRYAYFTSVVISGAFGLVYELIGGLIRNNIQLAEARRLHKDPNGNLIAALLKLRTIIPGIFIPIAVTLIQRFAKTEHQAKHVLSLIFLAFLTATVQLGNYGDLGLAPNFLLILIWGFSNTPWIRRIWEHALKYRQPLVFVILLPIFYFVFDKNGAAIAIINSTRVAFNFARDTFSNQNLLELKNIKGFSLPAPRLDRVKANPELLNEKSTEDLKQYQLGLEYANLIDYIETLDGTVFVDNYISAYPVLAAKGQLPAGARSWIMPYEFTENVSNYAHQMTQRSDYVINTNCAAPNAQPIKGTRFCAQPLLRNVR